MLCQSQMVGLLDTPVTIHLAVTHTIYWLGHIKTMSMTNMREIANSTLEGVTNSKQFINYGSYLFRQQ